MHNWVHLYNSSMSTYDIAKLYGVPQGRVRNRLVKVITLRSRGSQPGEQNNLWRGSEASYRSIHSWVGNHKPKSTCCEQCNAQGIRLEAANISKQYHRDIEDYRWLCVSCHRAYDNAGSKIRNTCARKRVAILFCKRGHEISILGRRQGSCVACLRENYRNWYQNNKNGGQKCQEKVTLNG